MEGERRGGESSRVSPAFVKSGDRQMFTVELRPGETTIVSWKKLVKDANKVNGSSASASTSAAAAVPAPEPPANAHPLLESRMGPARDSLINSVQQAGDEATDEPATNRFSAVIEKIERLYMGKDSSDDEDLNDVPDDDQYDTEDSFIDDAELDEYFQVDNSAIKHDGFFVNRGKLERISQPAVLPNQQPKKRRRKDLAKGNGENDDGRLPSKHTKLGKTAAAKITSAHAKNLSTSAQAVAVSGEHNEDVKFQNELNASAFVSKKKSSDAKTILDQSFLKVSNGDTSVALTEGKDTDKQKAGVQSSKDPNNKFKDVAISVDSSHQKHHDKSAYPQPRVQSARPMGDELESSVRAKEKTENREQPDVNTFEGKYSAPTTKSSHMHKKDGSSVRPKSSMLEKAIRELEKMVAESRPPAMENQEADNSSQAIKRRLPREVKMKLGKVARLAASHGKVSKELLNRLMNILGHVIQLRTLKRNLKLMISMSLSDKQEKDDKFQLIKKEVVDMIKTRAPSMELKALEQQAGATDNFQETANEEKEVSKRKFSMDASLEDKICDLYDLYVDGLDEDAGPQIRKLYAELAQLWPIGSMDNHGIKRAICRAKERRRALYNKKKDQEKIKAKKMLATKVEDGVRTEVNSPVSQAQYSRDKLATESCGQSSANKQVSTTTAAVRMPSPLNVPNFEKLKHDKVKGSAPEEARVGGDGALTKKKVKRKPETELDETRFRPEKSVSQQGEERPKPTKQPSSASLPQKSNLQSAAISSVEQSS